MRKTSTDAYNALKASGQLSKLRWIAYAGLFKHGPCTASELGQVLGIEGLWKRLTELERLGYVEVVAVRICTVTGMSVSVYDVTLKYPDGMKLSPSKPEIAYEVRADGYATEFFGASRQKAIVRAKEWVNHGISDARVWFTKPL